jgi:hypothetical protein
MARYSSRSTVLRLLLALGIMCVIAAGIVVPLQLVSGNPSSTGTDSPPHASGTTNGTPQQTACGRSECAVVDAVLSRPYVTVFYGASCTGPNGSWYLNVTRGGPNDSPRPSYRLQWAFLRANSSGRPSGLINVSTPPGERVAMTLSHGVLRLRGRTRTGVDVRATGTLTVRLLDTASGRALRFYERGVATAERVLGIVSPFGVHGRPTSVAMKLTRRITSC